MRRLAVIFIVVALVGLTGFGVDRYLTQEAERQASEYLSDRLGAPAVVELDGWPVSARLLGGTVPGVHVQSVGLEVGDVGIRRMDIAFRDVELDWRAVNEAEGFDIRAGRGIYTAELDEQTLSDAADMPGGIRLGEGMLQVHAHGQMAEAIAAVETEGLQFRPIGAVPEGFETVRVPLADLPQGMTVEQVRIVPGVLQISGSMTQLDLP